MISNPHEICTEVSERKMDDTATDEKSTITLSMF